MTDPNQVKKMKPVATVEFVTELDQGALQDLIDATDEAIRAGGGFGWIKVPARDIIERYWKGVLTMPARFLFVAKLDGVICGTAQLMTPPRNNEAQSFAVSLTANFVAPWARGHGLARMLLDAVEQKTLAEGYSVINLDVRETQEAAISLYEKHGYIKIGTHPYYARVDGKVVRGFYYYKVVDSAALVPQQ